jgi:MoxR-like ATPase
MVQAGQALALLRGRRHVLVEDIRDLAPDVLRHRLVLSYDALSDDVSADDILSRLLAAVSSPGHGSGVPADRSDYDAA